MADDGLGSSSESEANEVTKDDYIQHLKAEIKLLHREIANWSSCKEETTTMNKRK